MLIPFTGEIQTFLHSVPVETGEGASWEICKKKDRQVFGERDPFPRETCVPARVVTDGNVITALGTGFVDFGIAVCDWFGLFSTEEEKKQFTELYKG